MLLLGFAFVVPTDRASAHPHVWIDAEAVFLLESGKLTAVDVVWHLDQVVSATLLEDWDEDGDGRFNEEEQAALTEAIFPGMAEYGYFTVIRIDGEPVLLDKVDQFVPSMNGGVATYQFRVHLPEPVDPRTVPVELGLYDDTFYVAIDFKPAAITITGDGGEGCRTEVADDPDHPIYYGLVIPRKISLVCDPA